MQRINFEVVQRITVIIILIIPAFIISYIVQLEGFERVVSVIQSNLAMYLCGLFLLKSASIVYPPLPGTAVTLASIPVIGWEWAYAVDIFGSTLGASCAFFFGKRYGLHLIRSLMGVRMVKKITSFKLKQRNQIEASIMLRFATGGILSDALSWGAPLIGFSYAKYIVGYVISHLMTSFPVFYLLGIAVSFHSWIVLLIAMILAWGIMYKCKGRYFE